MALTVRLTVALGAQADQVENRFAEIIRIWARIFIPGSQEVVANIPAGAYSSFVSVSLRARRLEIDIWSMDRDLAAWRRNEGWCDRLRDQLCEQFDTLEKPRTISLFERFIFGLLRCLGFTNLLTQFFGLSCKSPANTDSLLKVYIVRLHDDLYSEASAFKSAAASLAKLVLSTPLIAANCLEVLLGRQRIREAIRLRWFRSAEFVSRDFGAINSLEMLVPA